MKRAASISALLLSLGLAACSTIATLDVHQEDADVSESGDPEGGDRFHPFSTNIPKGATVEVYNVTVGLNCRTGPSTNYMVVRLLAKGQQGTVLDVNATRKWYKLDIAGTQCWSYHYYLRRTSGNGQSVGGNAPQPAPANPNGFSGMTSNYVLSRNGIINAAKAFVGFSYWWGGGRFPKPWQTRGKSHGQCWKSGGYHHSGSYGADCSGFVSKVWQLPEAISFETNAHPFNTSSFRYNTTHWTNISRSAAQRGDALVYRGSTGGHIVIFSSGDAWGSMKTYEARGCSYGVVYNTRTVGTSYRARKRKGI